MDRRRGFACLTFHDLRTCAGLHPLHSAVASSTDSRQFKRYVTTSCLVFGVSMGELLILDLGS
jgi:hypothetical protein